MQTSWAHSPLQQSEKVAQEPPPWTHWPATQRSAPLHEELPTQVEGSQTQVPPVQVSPALQPAPQGPEAVVPEVPVGPLVAVLWPVPLPEVLAVPSVPLVAPLPFVPAGPAVVEVVVTALCEPPLLPGPLVGPETLPPSKTQVPAKQESPMQHETVEEHDCAALAHDVGLGAGLLEHPLAVSAAVTAISQVRFKVVSRPERSLAEPAAGRT